MYGSRAYDDPPSGSWLDFWSKVLDEREVDRSSTASSRVLRLVRSNTEIQLSDENTPSFTSVPRRVLCLLANLETIRSRCVDPPCFSR